MDLDPIDWGFRLADLMTFGAASSVMRPVKAIADALPLRVSGLDPLSTWLWMADAITNGVAGKRRGRLEGDAGEAAARSALHAALRDAHRLAARLAHGAGLAGPRTCSGVLP